jgi:hypothetical protein
MSAVVVDADAVDVVVATKRRVLDITSSAVANVLHHLRDDAVTHKKTVNAFWTKTGKAVAEPEGNELFAENAMPQLRTLLQRPTSRYSLPVVVGGYSLVLWDAHIYAQFYALLKERVAECNVAGAMAVFVRVQRPRREAEQEGSGKGDVKAVLAEFVQEGGVYEFHRSEVDDEGTPCVSYHHLKVLALSTTLLKPSERRTQYIVLQSV